MEGIRLRLERERVAESKKTNMVRGGSAGAIVDGRAIGNCVRASAARFLGHEPPRDEIEWMHKQLMFDAGHGNEDLWVSPLEISWVESGRGSIQREEEFPIEWKIDGKDGGGREDFVLLDPSGKPVTLIEQKLVCSLSTAVDVFAVRKPKPANLIQAANYALRAKVPAQLWYTSRVNWAVPQWKYIQDEMPSHRDVHHPVYPYLEWTKPYRKKDGSLSVDPQVKKITPFVIGYELTWFDGRVWWREFAAGKEWKRTDITPESIDAFYRETIAFARGDSNALPAPNSTAGLGERREHFRACDYCDWWTPVCSKATNRAEWLALVEATSVAHRPEET